MENPIDVIKIQQKLKTDEYANMDELKVGWIFFENDVNVTHFVT